MLVFVMQEDVCKIKASAIGPYHDLAKSEVMPTYLAKISPFINLKTCFLHHFIIFWQGRSGSGELTLHQMSSSNRLFTVRSNCYALSTWYKMA